ncbi:hypothetical protein D9M70_648580 [compost metagenome]
MPRHLRGDIALQRLNRFVRVGPGLIPEDGGHARKCIAGDFESNDSISEGRTGGIIGNRVNLRFVLPEGRFERRREILVLYQIETRQALVACP